MDMTLSFLFCDGKQSGAPPTLVLPVPLPFRSLRPPLLPGALQQSPAGQLPAFHLHAPLCPRGRVQIAQYLFPNHLHCSVLSAYLLLTSCLDWLSFKILNELVLEGNVMSLP